MDKVALFTPRTRAAQKSIFLTVYSHRVLPRPYFPKELFASCLRLNRTKSQMGCGEGSIFTARVPPKMTLISL